VAAVLKFSPADWSLIEVRREDGQPVYYVTEELGKFKKNRVYADDEGELYTCTEVTRFDNRRDKRLPRSLSSAETGKIPASGEFEVLKLYPQ
jgi:hypothetical protein